MQIAERLYIQGYLRSLYALADAPKQCLASLLLTYSVIRGLRVPRIQRTWTLRRRCKSTLATLSGGNMYRLCWHRGLPLHVKDTMLVTIRRCMPSLPISKLLKETLPHASILKKWFEFYCSTPQKVASPSDLLGNDWRIYELVCKNFIASLSPDCLYRKTKVQFLIGEERFCCHGIFTVSWAIKARGSVWEWVYVWVSVSVSVISVSVHGYFLPVKLQ